MLYKKFKTVKNSRKCNRFCQYSKILYLHFLEYFYCFNLFI